MSRSAKSQKSVRLEAFKAQIISHMSENKEMQITDPWIKHLWSEAGLRTFARRHGWSCRKHAWKEIWTINQPGGKKWNR